MMIGMSGKAGAGKDTVGGYLVEKHGYVRLSFADALKDLALQLNPLIGYRSELLSLVTAHADHGWAGVKQQVDGRDFLQRLGQGIRDLDADFWIRRVEDQLAVQIAEQGTLHPKVVITDVRYGNEAQFVKAWGGRVWRVHRDVELRTGADHQSETDLDDWKFDFHLENVSTFDFLFEQVDRALMAPDAT